MVLSGRCADKMRVGNISMLLIPFILTLSTDLIAQEALPIKPGDRVRVTSPEYEWRPIGTVITLDADSLVVKVVGYRDPITLPLSVLTQLEVTRAKRPIGKNALVGLGAGAALGGLFGFIVAEEDDYFGPSDSAIIGAGFFGSIGLVFGALTGVIPVDYWEEVPLDQIRVGISPQPNGRLVFSVSLALPSMH